MKIAIVGAGGLGSYIGGRLMLSGHDVTFISQGKQLDALHASGLKIESHLGNAHIKRVRATDNCMAVGQVHLIILCVELCNSISTIEQISPMVAPHTTIFSIQNNIDHFHILDHLFNKYHTKSTPGTLAASLKTQYREGHLSILGGVTIIDAQLLTPNHVRGYHPRNSIFFGNLGSTLSSECLIIAELFKFCGLDCQLVPDIFTKMSAYKNAMVARPKGVHSQTFTVQTSLNVFEYL